MAFDERITPGRRSAGRRRSLPIGLLLLAILLVDIAPRIHRSFSPVAYSAVKRRVFVPLVAGARMSPPAPSAPPSPAPSPGPTGVAAFPGAEGFGTTTPGGRGGRVLYVTTLADAGPGSLRSALTASGPRIVLFQVAGTITLDDDIVITSPFLTIAGQSAPGEGVQIRGGMLHIRTHDVVIRYLRLRPGDDLNGSAVNTRDALTVNGTDQDDVYNVVLDHCSLIWGPDIGGASLLGGIRDITIQNTIIGEGLYLSNHPEGTAAQDGHSLGLNITQLDTSAYPMRITLHHNLLTTADHRMPQIMGGASIDVVNNVVYNWGVSPAQGNPRSVNLINNLFIKGPMTTSLLAWETRTNAENPTLRPGSVYEHGTVVEGLTTVRGDPQMVYASARFAPYSMRVEQTAQDAYERIVQDVGATRPVRDRVEQRIINNLRNRQGTFLNGTDLEWPSLALGPIAVDADADGMADAWELQWFGTLSRGTPTDSRGDFDRDGYTDVEEYLNGSDPVR
ncbi:MAG TPA: hypothetical protein VGD69_02275 [Herpetosiphonaceae bacterium]